MANLSARKLIDRIKVALIEKITPNSLYLRGSVNTRNFVNGVSDVDFVIVTKEKVSDFAKQEVQFYLNKIEEQQSIFTKIDIMWLTETDATTGPFRVLLKLSGICIYGTNVIPQIKEVDVRKGIYLTVKFLDDEIRILSKNKYKINSHTISKTCTWIMKRLLRSGVEILTPETGQYSRDLYTCYFLFSQKFPAYERDMYNALLLALKPTSSVNKINILVEKLGRLICHQYKLKIKTSSYVPKTARISK